MITIRTSAIQTTTHIGRVAVVTSAQMNGKIRQKTSSRQESDGMLSAFHQFLRIETLVETSTDQLVRAAEGAKHWMLQAVHYV